MLAGVGDGLPDDLLVAEMDAVEDPDGEADFASASLKFARVVNDLHGAKGSDNEAKRRMFLAGL